MRIRVAGAPFWNMYALFLLFPGATVLGLIWAIKDYDGEHLGLIIIFSLMAIVFILIAIIAPIYFFVVYAPLSLLISKKKCYLKNKGKVLFSFSIEQIEIRWENERQSKVEKNVIFRALFYYIGYYNDLTIISIRFESYLMSFEVAIFRSTFLLLRNKINKLKKSKHASELICFSSSYLYNNTEINERFSDVYVVTFLHLSSVDNLCLNSTYDNAYVPKHLNGNYYTIDIAKSFFSM